MVGCVACTAVAVVGTLLVSPALGMWVVCGSYVGRMRVCVNVCDTLMSYV